MNQSINQIKNCFKHNKPYFTLYIMFNTKKAKLMTFLAPCAYKYK